MTFVYYQSGAYYKLVTVKSPCVFLVLSKQIEFSYSESRPLQRVRSEVLRRFFEVFLYFLLLSDFSLFIF